MTSTWMFIIHRSLFLVANLVTALVHLSWNELVKSAIPLVGLCLSNPAIPILQGIVQLHCLILAFLAIALCFNATSATQFPLSEGARSSVLNFDDIPTVDGFASVPDPYGGLIFEGFYALDPADSSLVGRISPNDLNCAVSKPNALYGSRYNILNADHMVKHGIATEPNKQPSIKVALGKESFTLHSFKIKPLDMPLAYVTINLRGTRVRNSNDNLTWAVDFPYGFHEVLHVNIESFSHTEWTDLEKVEIWADFHHAGTVMDWEFCLDDLRIGF